MSPSPTMRGIQKLRSSRDAATGEVWGMLRCAVFVQLSDIPLSIEDTLENVVVGDVLNPVGGQLLADEVQRAMRLGIAHWLLVEACEDRVRDVVAVAGGGGHRVMFEIPMMDGRRCKLHVDVPGDAMASAARQAVQRVSEWAAEQAWKPLDSEAVAVLSHADLSKAPHLCSGMALLRSGTRAQS